MAGRGYGYTVVVAGLFWLLSGPMAVAGDVIFVDADATGSNNGTSWTNAFTNLQDALTAAESGGATELWVAAGVYRPAGLGGDRSATFQLVNHVAVLGGFAGNEGSAAERDFQTNPTILSGDVNGDDGPGFTNNADNVYHVVTASGTDNTALLDGFIIAGGNANATPSTNRDGRGGGILNFAGRALIRNCVIRFNRARFGGGGMANNAAAPDVRHCSFVGNTGGLGAAGLGVLNENRSTPSFTHCLFLGNQSTGLTLGGGMYNHASTAVIVNGLFTGNRSGAGGAIVNDAESSATLVNSTVSANEATLTNGGGILNVNDSQTIVWNSILWNNRDPRGRVESAQIHFTSGDVSVNRSCIHGWTGSLGGVGNIGDDPLFVDPDGADDSVGTMDDDTRLSPGSPCIDAADSTQLPLDIVFDLDGLSRFIDDPASPESGVPAGPGQPIVDMGAYEYQADCNNNGVVDDEDITGGQSDDCNHNIIPDECEPDCNENGVADSCDIDSHTSTDVNSNGRPDECDILFVNAVAGGANNGTNWTDAFDDLQHALAAAAASDGDIIAIWVAEGTYTPAPPNSDRSMSFHLMDGVSLYGGFTGGENQLTERDPIQNETILSGDLNGDDGVSALGEIENSYHVVVGSGTSATAVIDGFTITGGRANAGAASDPNSRGGGVYNSAGSPTVHQCRIERNFASTGGAGMFNGNGSHPTVTNTTFIENTGGLLTAGLGMFNRNSSSPHIERCAFINNSAVQGVGLGGGIYNFSNSHPVVINTLFGGNRVAIGGAMVNDGQCRPTLINCTLHRNAALDGEGGGLWNVNNSSPTILNSILWANSDDGGMDESAQIHTASGSLTVNYSCVLGLSGALGGIGNIGINPRFVDDNGDDGLFGTEDDDLRLQPISPCIDAADSPSVPDDITVDYDLLPRFVDTPGVFDIGNPDGDRPVVDMGAFEFQRETPLPDCNKNEIVELEDYACFFFCAGGPGGGLFLGCDIFDADFDLDVDLLDFGSLQQKFGASE